jgi:hypothetical protein
MVESFVSQPAGSPQHAVNEPEAEAIMAQIIAVLSEIATFLAPPGVAPGASIYVADAALGTADHLVALGDTVFMSRLPATSMECGRLIADAVAPDTWEEVGVLASTEPTEHRPASS